MSDRNYPQGMNPEAIGSRPFTGQRGYYPSGASEPNDTAFEFDPPTFTMEESQALDEMVRASPELRMAVAPVEQVVVLVRDGSQIFERQVPDTATLAEIYPLGPGGWWLLRHGSCSVVSTTIPLWRIVSDVNSRHIHLDAIYPVPNPFLIMSRGSRFPFN